MYAQFINVTQKKSSCSKALVEIIISNCFEGTDWYEFSVRNGHVSDAISTLGPAEKSYPVGGDGVVMSAR